MSDADEPHRIRLRDWDAFSTLDGQAVLRRHFHRPTNLQDCEVQVRVDGATPESVRINNHPLPCTRSEDDVSSWQVDVAQLLDRNLIECTFATAPLPLEICLEIYSPHRGD